MTTTPLTKQDRKNRAVRTWILIIGTLFVLAMAYGSGMRGQVKKLQAVNEERKVDGQDLRLSHGGLLLRRVLLQQMEARRQADLALLELDNRNFGTAQEHLTQAVALLNTAREAAASAAAEGEAVTVPETGDAADRLSAIKLTAGDDTGAQRTQILGVMQQLDRSLNSFLPGYLQSAASFDDELKAKLKKKNMFKPSLNDVPQIPGNDVTRTR